MPFELYCEKLGAGKTCFLFIHGWGFNRNIWREQALLLADSHSVILVDLPGFGRSPFSEKWSRFDELSSPISDLVSGYGFSDVILVGWSLGAAMAARMALNWGSRTPVLRGLVMVGASPSYTNPPGEKFAIEEVIYKRTLRNIKRKYPEFFYDFSSVLLGDIGTKIKGCKIPAQKSLIHSLELFYKDSLFDVLPRVRVPSLVMHGGEDAVFSERAGRAVSSLLPDSRFILFPRDGHAPFIDSKEQFHREMLNFYQRTTHNTAKKNIRHSFSEAHTTYDEEAGYQKTTGKRLVDILSEKRTCDEVDILDVGTGTGFLASEILYKTNVCTKIVGCDISLPMLNHAVKNTQAKTNSIFRGIASDAEFLSFGKNSFDWVLSNMMYHWVNPLYVSFQEVFRVLRSEGKFLFSVAAEGTLNDLQKAYETTMKEHYPSASQRAFYLFPPREQIETAINEAGFRACEVFSEPIEVPYASMTGMLRSFKRLGALNPGTVPRAGLLGKKFIERMGHYYMDLTSKEEIIGKYEILYVLASK